MQKPPEKLNYKARLLDDFIEATRDAITRGRAAWLLGIIIVFVFGVAVFNATLSWNDEQITRRANLYSAAVKGYEAVKSLAERDKSIGHPLNWGTGELGYLQPLWEAAKNKREAADAVRIPEDAMDGQDDKTKAKLQQERVNALATKQRLENEASEAMKELREIVYSNLSELITRRNAFDTVVIPFLGIHVTGSDYGIIGGIALIIVGYWLLAMLRRELLVLSEFVRIGEDKHLKKGHTQFDTDGLIYACHKIKHYMVFSIPEPKSWLSYVTTASFFAAPFLLMLNHFISVRDLFMKHLWTSYWHWHFVTEGIIMLLGVAVWTKGWFYQYRSMQLMQLWEIESRKKNPFPDE